jgi:hypothetical protein
MDERLREKKHWIVLGALAIVFLCVLLCALGAFGMLVVRSGPAYVQPPTGEEGVVPPTMYHGRGPLSMGQYGGWGPFGIIGFGFSLLFKLAFFGLLLLLLFGLIRRLFWGRRHPWPPYWGKPPQGKEGEKGSGAAWGPWAWHHHRKHWGPHPGWGAEPEPAGREGEPDPAESEYTGPQE